MIELSPLRRKLAWWCFAFAWFAMGHFYITWPVWGDPLARLPGPTGDNCMMAWNLGWVKYALDRGMSGFWCSAAYFPDGFLFIYGSHIWLDGLLYWLMSWLLPAGYEGAILWANITLLLATIATGLLTVSALRAWGVVHWPVLIMAGSGVAFSWFRMFALMGHYNFFGTQWMLLALCILSWALRACRDYNKRRCNLLVIWAGIALGVSFLNDQTMAIFGGILGGMVLLSLPRTGGSLKQHARQVVAGALRYYGCAIIPASIHLVPILVHAAAGRLGYYHVDKSLPRLVDASSFLIPNNFHLIGRHLEGLRERTGLGWSEGTYLGFVPMILLLMAIVGAVRYVLTRAPVYKICFVATLAAWSFLIIGLGDRLMIGREQYFLLPGRLLKEIPLLNNMRVPQRWVWPAHLSIALGGTSVLGLWLGRFLQSHGDGRRLTVVLAPLVLAAVPILEGRSYPIPAPVNFRNDPFIRPPGLVEEVRKRHTTGSVLTMPVEVTYAHANILQFLWGYDIPMAVVYSARMPLDVQELPWKWNSWFDEAGEWLREKKIRIVVFPFHGGKVDEFQQWVEGASQAVPGLVVLNQNGEEI